MGYYEVFPVRLVVDGSREKANKPDCSPHPLDIMAIFAIHQTK